MNIKLPKAVGPVRPLCVLLAWLSMFALSDNSLAAPGAYRPPLQPGTQLQEATFTLDNVELTISTPFLPMVVPTDHPFVVSTLDATASSTNPWSTFEIVAVPFGTRPTVVNVPAAQSGQATAYMDALRAGGKPYEVDFDANGPVASLFGQQVTGQVSLLQLRLNTDEAHPAIVVQWVVEAGQRLWLVRVVEQLPDGTADLSGQAGFLSSLERLTLTSNNVNSPTTLKPSSPSGTPSTPTVPGMPRTGGVSTWDYGYGSDMPAFLVVLLGGVALLGGFYLRRRGRGILP